jgi:cholest-4-en-3-one 26-monooxygenase
VIEAPPTIDLNDLDRWAEGVPHGWFEWLRRHDPVHRHHEPDGPGFWVVTRWADVTGVGRRADVFANAPSHIGLGKGDEFSRARQAGLMAAVVAITRAERRLAARSPAGASGRGGDGGVSQFQHLLTMDGEEHDAYRRLLKGEFTPGAIRRLEPRVRELARDRIRAVIERGECDFVVDLAMRLPMDVLSEVLGVPQADRDAVCRWSNEVMGSVDPEYRLAPETTAHAIRDSFAYFADLGGARRACPAHDVVSVLAEADLPPARFLAYTMMLTVAGNETTRNGISLGMHALTNHRDQWELLGERPELVAGAVEESLRFASPVAYMRRTAVEDTEIAGVPIAAGDVVSLWYPSANFDDEVFADPYRFDIRRAPNPHLAFGSGPHFCLGAFLARLELKVMIEETRRWMPDLEPSGEPVRLRNNHINGVKHLPVRFSPRPASTIP